MTILLPLTFGLAVLVGGPAKLADLEFGMAIEESIMAEPGTAPPEPFRGLLWERDRYGAPILGSAVCSVRESGSRAVTTLSVLDRRWLFWGRRHKDPEVRLRSNTVLRRLNLCQSCGGRGVSRRYELDPCWDCHGIGSVWGWTAFD